MPRWIAGLDGCRGAWAGVLLDLDAPERHRAAVFGTVEDALDGPEAPVIVGRDDHLDAMAAVVVARDITAGSAVPLPPIIEHEACGLPIVIWAPADCL